MKKETINKYDLIKKFAIDTISLIELTSNRPYQTALKFVIDESENAKTWEIPYIHGRIIQWDIDTDKLENNVEDYIKNEFNNVSTHDFLDQVTANIAIKFKDYDFAAIMRTLIVEKILFYYKLSRTDFLKSKEKTLDLFKVVTKNKLHSNFENLLRPEYALVRKTLESWAEDFEDRDNKFAKQFQETFNSMFWELYLYQCFRVLKMDIDFSKQSPDFIVKSHYGNEFVIEAVITNGTKGDRHHYVVVKSYWPRVYKISSTLLPIHLVSNRHYMYAA